jgi:hypothetical protein
VADVWNLDFFEELHVRIHCSLQKFKFLLKQNRLKGRMTFGQWTYGQAKDLFLDRCWRDLNSAWNGFVKNFNLCLAEFLLQHEKKRSFNYYKLTFGKNVKNGYSWQLLLRRILLLVEQRFVSGNNVQVWAFVPQSQPDTNVSIFFLAPCHCGRGNHKLHIYLFWFSNMKNCLRYTVGKKWCVGSCNSRVH